MRPLGRMTQAQWVVVAMLVGVALGRAFPDRRRWHSPLSGTVAQFGLPLEGVAVILGVDAFMDMARTSLNLLGNCLASVLMARWEGSFESPEDVMATDRVTGLTLGHEPSAR